MIRKILQNPRMRHDDAQSGGLSWHHVKAQAAPVTNDAMVATVEMEGDD